MADLEENLKGYLKQIEFLDMTREYGARTYYIYKAMTEAMWLTYRAGSALLIWLVCIQMSLKRTF